MLGLQNGVSKEILNPILGSNLDCHRGSENVIFRHENVDKLILHKFADKVGFHLNISSTMKKNAKLVSRLDCAYVIYCLFIVLFSVVTTFSNFQASFPLISPKVFGIFTPNFTTKVRKI